MSTYLVTNNYRNYSSKALIAALTKNYVPQIVYFFYGSHVPATNTNSVPEISEDYKNVNIDSYRNMIAGKAVSVNDVSLVVRNIPYVAGIVYTMYDATDRFLKDKNFFVIVDEGAYFHVYKCLDNNNNSVSTVQPSFADVQNSSSYLYQTSDGYRWKYMYSVTSAAAAKFSTTEYFPVTSNTQVQAAAVAGHLDIIEVEDGGRGYDNYIYGTFSGSDIKIDGNSSIYSISTPGADSSNGFYTGCLIYLSNGTGAGQYSRILDYYSTNTGKYIQIDKPFVITPTNGTTFQITPEVTIYGDGNQTINAVSRALINALSSNSIYRAELLDRGAGYSFFTANAVANTVVNIQKHAVLEPMYSPIKGHGFDPTSELFSNSIMISVSLAGSEGNTIPVQNEYQQVGFIRNPMFANVQFSLTNPAGVFLNSEKLYKISKSKYLTNCISNTSTSTLTCPSGDLVNQFVAGQLVFASDGNNSIIASINSITNSTSLTLNTIPSFFSNTITLYSANIQANAVIISVNTQNNISLSNCQPYFSTGDFIVGALSGATANISTITINGATKTFSTFLQLNKYTVTTKSGSFETNELVYQTSIDTANASYFGSTVENSEDVIYTSNQVGSFSIGQDIIGNTSGSIATITSKYSGDVVFGSGDVLYLENISPVQRLGNTESFKFIFEF